MATGQAFIKIFGATGPTGGSGPAGVSGGAGAPGVTGSAGTTGATGQRGDTGTSAVFGEGAGTIVVLTYGGSDQNKMLYDSNNNNVGIIGTNGVSLGTPTATQLLNVNATSIKPAVKLVMNKSPIMLKDDNAHKIVYYNDTVLLEDGIEISGYKNVALGTNNAPRTVKINEGEISTKIPIYMNSKAIGFGALGSTLGNIAYDGTQKKVELAGAEGVSLSSLLKKSILSVGDTGTNFSLPVALNSNALYIKSFGDVNHMVRYNDTPGEDGVEVFGNISTSLGTKSAPKMFQVKSDEINSKLPFYMNNKEFYLKTNGDKNHYIKYSGDAGNEDSVEVHGNTGVLLSTTSKAKVLKATATAVELYVPIAMKLTANIVYATDQIGYTETITFPVIAYIQNQATKIGFSSTLKGGIGTYLCFYTVNIGMSSASFPSTPPINGDFYVNCSTPLGGNRSIFIGIGLGPTQNVATDASFNILKSNDAYAISFGGVSYPSFTGCVNIYNPNAINYVTLASQHYSRETNQAPGTAAGPLNALCNTSLTFTGSCTFVRVA